jgi:hypothetical protein
MQRLINTLAMTAAVVALMAGLWQDWSLLTTLKRVLITYLGFFFLFALMVLGVKAASLFEKPAEDAQPGAEKEESRGRASA